MDNQLLENDPNIYNAEWFKIAILTGEEFQLPELTVCNLLRWWLDDNSLSALTNYNPFPTPTMEINSACGAGSYLPRPSNLGDSTVAVDDTDQIQENASPDKADTVKEDGSSSVRDKGVFKEVRKTNTSSGLVEKGSEEIKGSASNSSNNLEERSPKEDVSDHEFSPPCKIARIEKSLKQGYTLLFEDFFVQGTP